MVFIFLGNSILFSIYPADFLTCNRAWKNLLSDSDWSNSVACIGETTAAMAGRLGFKNVYHPTQPGLEG